MINYLSENIKRVIVTGGCGFIGGALIRRLLENTELEIFNIDKLSYSSDLKNIDLLLQENNVYRDRYHFLNVDLANEFKTEEAVEFSNPDLVFHLAAESHVDRSIEDPKVFISSNIVGTFNLLQSTKRHWEKLSSAKKAIFRFHHISTDEVFGSLESFDDFFSETTPYSPRSPYSATKASSDHLVNAWHHTYGLPTLITNCSNNFGPWQFPEKLIPLVVLKAIKSEDIPIYGKGLNIRDWLYVEDHIEGLLLVAGRAKPGNTYCIGGRNELTNKEIVLKICEILEKLKPSNKPYKNLIKYVEDRPGHDLRYAINSQKIKKELGWEPKYNFSYSLEKTVQWYLDNLIWCENLTKKSGYSGQRLGKK